MTQRVFIFECETPEEYDKSSTKLKDLLDDGWKILSSTPKTIIQGYVVEMAYVLGKE